MVSLIKKKNPDKLGSVIHRYMGVGHSSQFIMNSRHFNNRIEIKPPNIPKQYAFPS